MGMNVRRRAALIVAVTALCVVSLGVGSAFGFTIPFVNYAVSGTLTPKKLAQPVTLPRGSTFNGGADFTALPPEPGWEATVSGKLAIPPFTAKLKLVGLIPTSVGLTFTEVGTSEGTITPAPEADCAGASLPGPCASMDVTSKAVIGITEVGLLEIPVPVVCRTSQPVVFNLATHLTFQELAELGPHFAGTVTIPPIECDGLEGLLVAPLLSTLMSGPDNPYALTIALRETEAPSAQTLSAQQTTQVSSVLSARVDPNGAPLTACTLEYGISEKYGSTAPCLPEPSAIKSLFTGNLVYGQAAGLSPGTTYHYRVLVTNSEGTTAGQDETFTTLAASETPEYGRCVAQKKGEYANEGCTTKSAKKGKGNHEWIPGPPSSACVAQKKGEYTDAGCTMKSTKAHKGHFEKLPGPGYTTAGGAVVIETEGLASTVECASSSGGGEVTGSSTGTLRLTFTGCESAGKKCTSEGPNSTPSGTAGVIETNLLETQLIGSGTEPFTQLASGEHAPYVLEFGCEGTHFRTTGALAGMQGGDVDRPSATSTTTFAFPSGEQALGTEQQSGKGWSAKHPTVLTGTLSNTAASSTEIR